MNHEVKWRDIYAIWKLVANETAPELLEQVDLGFFKKIKNDSFFSKVFVDEALQTVTWPGELDLDPDDLYQQGIDLEMLQGLIQAAKRKMNSRSFLNRRWRSCEAWLDSVLLLFFKNIFFNKV